MIAFVALALSHSLRGLDAPVSLEMRACRLSDAMKVLEPKVGMKLNCDGALRDAVVVVSVHEVPAKDLLDRLAIACDGKWTLERTGEMTLNLDKARVEAQKATQLKVRTDRIAGALRRMKDKLEKAGPYDDASIRRLIGKFTAFDEEANSTDPKERSNSYELFRGMKGDMPGHRALERIAVNLDPEFLARLPEGESVLSNRPTRMEFPIPD